MAFFAKRIMATVGQPPALGCQICMCGVLPSIREDTFLRELIVAGSSRVDSQPYYQR